MSLRKIAALLLAAVGALLVAVVLYLAFGDLSRHKGRIESLVTNAIGRPFAIDGAFALEILPSISVVAERVRVGNADWGSKPQMVELGRVSAKVGLWSLVSGPIDVRSLEVSDLSVLLETGPDGKGNWVLGDQSAPQEAAETPESGAAAAPPVLRDVKIANVRVTYRDRGKPDQVARIETFSIGPGSDGLLAISGKGGLNEFPVSVNGEVGPLDALVSGQNIRLAIQAVLGELRVEAKGGFGRLDPLAKADVALKVMHPDVGTMLKKLHLPVMISGPLSADVRLADAGELTRLDVAAKVGDITLKVGGTLRALGLPGSDLRIDASVPEPARVAAALDVTGLPAGALELGGRILSSRTEIKLDGMTASFAGAKARVDGTVRLARAPSTELRFDLTAENLARLQQGLPEVPLSLSGNFASVRDKLEVKNVKGRIAESEFSAQVSMSGTRRKRVDVDLASPRLDLTPFAAKKAGEEPKPKPKPAERKFVFDEAPLPLDGLKAIDARVHVALTELRLGTGFLRDVDSTLLLDGGKLNLEGRVRDGLEGTLSALVKLTPADGGAAALDINVSAKNVRVALGTGDTVDPKEAPTTNIEARLVASGASARQMAAGANGRVLVTQGAGKLPGGILGLVGGDLLRELVGKLNPFAAQDPYTQLDCTVVRADIVDGQVAVHPVLMQSQKVTIVAGGRINLGTEAMRFNFNTRPRTGVGISAGMFTNPFIEVAGTLASPRLGVGAKGTAAAAATGGLSVLAQGLVDRTRGGQDVCKPTLDEAVGATK